MTLMNSSPTSWLCGIINCELLLINYTLLINSLMFWRNIFLCVDSGYVLKTTKGEHISTGCRMALATPVGSYQNSRGLVAKALTLHWLSIYPNPFTCCIPDLKKYENMPRFKNCLHVGWLCIFLAPLYFSVIQSCIVFYLNTQMVDCLP